LEENVFLKEHINVINQISFETICSYLSDNNEFKYIILEQYSKKELFEIFLFNQLKSFISFKEELLNFMFDNTQFKKLFNNKEIQIFQDDSYLQFTYTSYDFSSDYFSDHDALFFYFEYHKLRKIYNKELPNLKINISEQGFEIKFHPYLFGFEKELVYI